MRRAVRQKRSPAFVDPLMRSRADELVEIVEFLKDPAKFTRLGGKLPKVRVRTRGPGRDPRPPHRRACC
jgi:hypothetical protein